MAGLSVCVLEAKNVIGGCTATVECTLPGFKHDIGSVALGAIQSNPVYADDELGIREKYGFEFIDTKKNGATLYPDGTGVLEDGDLAHELEQIAAYSPEDAPSLRAVHSGEGASSSADLHGHVHLPASYGPVRQSVELHAGGP